MSNYVKELKGENSLADRDRLIKVFVLNAIGFVLSGMNIYGFNPSGIGYFMALSSIKGTALLSIGTFICGMLFHFTKMQMIKNGAILITGIAVCKILSTGKLLISKKIVSVWILIFTFLMELVNFLMGERVSFESGSTIISLGMILAASVLTAALYLIYSTIIQSVMDELHIFENEELAGISFVVGLFLYNVAKLFHTPQSMMFGLFFGIVLFTAYKYGIAVGAVMGLSCGISASVAFGNNYVGILCMMGIVAGVFRKLGKAACIFAMLVIGALGYYGVFDEMFRYQEVNVGVVKGMIAAAVIFGMLPKSICSRYEESMKNNEVEDVKSMCEEKLLNIAKTFENLSMSFYSSGNEKEEKAKVSTNQQNDTMMDKMWKNRLLEGRQMMSEQLSQISRVIQDYSKQVYDFVKVTDKEEEYIRQRLKLKKVQVQKIVGLKNSKNRKEYLITAKCNRGVTIGSREIAGVLSEVFGKEIIPSKNCRKIISMEYTTTTYVEQTNFYAVHGAAKKARGTLGISGDNYSVKEFENGHLLMGLSDGMGYGTSACLESETVIELLEQLLDNGFDPECALKMINSVMIMNSVEEHPATLDYGLIDLHSGMCDMVKIGAAATFVKRGNWVETIKSTSMPLGIFQEVDYDSASKKLYDGDTIIMVSDGVLDAMDCENKDEKLSRIISELSGMTPTRMAECILEKAVTDESRLTDDCTVLVTKIKERDELAA